MNIRSMKAWVPALGLALTLSAVGGGVALGAGEEGWYEGGNATVPDPDRTAVALKLYDGTGTEVTSGSTTAPLAAYAAAGGTIRAGDDHASLFVHLPQSDTAPGAWPGLQVTGTDAYVSTPRVATTADGYTLADVEQALPNEETGASFAGVYELRLRTSSEDAGVGTAYAATWVKVTGSTWQVTTAPVLGDEEPEPDPEPVATSVSVTWPSALRYGTAASAVATVTPASGATVPTGSVRLVLGSQTLATATLAGGKATLAVPRTLVPGTRTLQVVYGGATDTFTASSSAAKAFSVAKAAPGRPTLKVTKKPTTKKAGAALVAVPTASGLVVPSGSGVLTLVKGKTVKKVTVRLASGKATVKLPKLPKGAWKVTFTYAGDTSYLTAVSPSVTVKSKAAKK